MSDLDPIIGTAKAATQSIKSAIQSGKEISSAVESIQNFGMAEVKARHAFKAVRKSQVGEITIMTAMRIRAMSLNGESTYASTFDSVSLAFSFSAITDDLS